MPEHLQYTNIPPELFIDICSFLPPADLLSLSQVCRKFHGYLRAPNSLATQQIWKESRLQFIPNEDLPPPEGMSEEKYVELLMMERGCQICKRNKKCKIHWVFAVRCCKQCFSNKATCWYTLNLINCPLEFVDVMPYTYNAGYGTCKRYYWIEQIDHAYSQYYSLSKKMKKSWLNDKKHIFVSLMEYSMKRDVLKEKIYFFSYFYFRYACRHLNYYHSSFLRPYSPPSIPPSLLYPPLSRHLGKNVNVFQLVKFPRSYSTLSGNLKKNKPKVDDISQLIQFHIKRLENELHQSIFNVGVRLTNNNLIKIQKQKSKSEFYNKFNTKKGKNSKNKFVHKYG
ncbi:hypothetical protein C1645_857132 [Glomus cerebriforme]|uniref:F-box domain-containing protein n=1 Tax=Glomus cerebriforme TaxID=658196 RepID=A0A397TX51_9GLOM|nr:hypothetical protein C1645_857132 [Glomus cerebriforme]